MDFHMGRILAALKELGLLDQTLVLFSADQGIALGSHGLLGKQNLYDAGMKCPLVFAGPGIPHGASDALLYLLDIYPTVLDLVGAPIPAGLDGCSFRGAFRDNKFTARNELFLSYRDVQRAWRDERWKIIRYPQVNVTQLFDLQNDPDEMRNLAGEAAQQLQVEALLAKLKAQQAVFGDTLPLTPTPPGGRRRARTNRRRRRRARIRQSEAGLNSFQPFRVAAGCCLSAFPALRNAEDFRGNSLLCQCSGHPLRSWQIQPQLGDRRCGLGCDAFKCRVELDVEA